ncbi:MAG: NADAR family protein [Saprospiraceae bacterium]|nr:NADAR family protein [Saprospiraceae bacterium]
MIYEFAIYDLRFKPVGWEQPFEGEGLQYRTAEHWMMAWKARLFNDEEMLAKIRSQIACKSEEIRAGGAGFAQIAAINAYQPNSPPVRQPILRVYRLRWADRVV